MKMRAHGLGKLFTVLSFVLLGAAWVAFAPLQFGGQAAYVIVNGNSMEPLYHRGDLVIIRAQPDYRIGDIVTYRHPDIGPVIHRIIGRDAGRFVFKGDHNDFIDPYEPVQADLIGKAWIYLPSAGKVLDGLRAPRHMALLAGVGGFIMIFPLVQGDDPAAKRRRGPRRARRPRPAASQTGRPYESLLGALAFLAIVSLALAAFAFTRPTTHEVADEVTYQQLGTFAYSASAPAGLYDSNTVQTGEPLFPELTGDTTFTFDYKLTSDQPADPQGFYRLVAEVSAASGWKRTIELRPATAFRGAFSASGVLDFVKVRALIDRFEQQTGLERQQYTLAIVPEVNVKGSLGGAPLQDEFAPRLEFRVDKTQIQLLRDGRDGQNPLTPSKSGVLKPVRVEPNIISLPLLKLDVTLARRLSAGGASVALIGILWLGLLMLQAVRPSEAARIRSKYGSLMIDATGSVQFVGEHVVQIAAIHDLARLAEKSGQLILYEACGTTHWYSVHDGGTTYYYQFVSACDDRPVDPRHTPGVTTASTGETWHAIFLEALREKGIIAHACRLAGVSLPEVYAERSRVPAFAQAWNEARAACRESLSSEVSRL
jgi:signal peptidase I